MNIIQLMGRLGADAETRFTPSGMKVTTIRMACNSRRKDQEETIWYKVTLWGDRWDRMLPYLTKGSAVIVSGELRKPEIYTDRNGSPAIQLEVWADAVRFNPFGGNRSEEQGSSSFQQQGSESGNNPWTQSSSEGAAAAFNHPGAQGSFNQASSASPYGAADGSPQNAGFANMGQMQGGQMQEVGEDEIPF